MLPGCPRPLLIAPSKSIKSGKVAAAYAEEREHWQVRDDYSWVSYHDLQSGKGDAYLEALRPGILILDEAHHAGRYDSSRTKCIERYRRANRHVPIIVLTGSLIASRVVNDSLTLCDWARGTDSPLPHPTAKSTQRFWKLALDVPQRCEPGALRRWCKPREPTVSGVGRRYYETPGIVCSAGENVIGTSLSAETHVAHLRSSAVLEAFAHVRAGRGPDGGELLDTDGHNTWTLTQTLALGFYYVFDPKPPADWTDAYRNWASACREHIASTDCECDTETRARVHILADDPDFWPLADWLRIKSIYRKQQATIWLDKSRLHAAKQWMDSHRHGIVWTQFKGFGQALATFASVPYYSGNARDKQSKRYITQHQAGQPCVASIKSCSEDLNLQRQFYQNLFVAPPATGAWQEQAIARTHRYGCAWPEVSAEYWIACAENRDALSVARAREKNAARMTGDFSRKMLIADWTETKTTKLEGPQWLTKKIAHSLMK
jgi:hypothetical protein